MYIILTTVNGKTDWIETCDTEEQARECVAEYESRLPVEGIVFAVPVVAFAQRV